MFRTCAMGLAVTAAILALAAAPAQARRHARLGYGETIGPGSTYSTGPIAFSAEFYGVSSIISPHSGPGGPGGLIAFLPGGFAQVRFPALQQPVRLKCEVGNSGSYLVTQNVGGNQTFQNSLGANALPGSSLLYIIFDIADFAPPQDVQLSIRPDSAVPLAWNLTGCTILPKP